MARYRKIDIRIWNDRKFRSLDDNAKLAFFLVLTHPDTNQLGMLRSRSPALAMELGWHPDVMSDAIKTLCRMGMLMVDDMAGFVFIPNFLKYNPPNGPNAVKGWGGLLDQMPECDLLNHAINCLNPFINGLSEKLQEVVPDDIRDAINNAIPDDIRDAPRIQEQEQEQEQYINTNKQQTEISEAIEPSAGESVCCVSSHEDCFDEGEDFDAPVKVQAEQKQLEHLDTEDETKPLTLVELITACKTYGIRLSHTPKTEAIADRKTVTLAVLRECAKTWKATSTGTGYFVGILDNASKDPQSILPHEKREKPELSAETISDKQAGYFASQLVHDPMFCSKYAKGFQDYGVFASHIAANLRNPRYFDEYKPHLQRLGFM